MTVRVYVWHGREIVSTGALRLYMFLYTTQIQPIIFTLTQLFYTTYFVHS